MSCQLLRPLRPSPTRGSSRRHATTCSSRSRACWRSRWQHWPSLDCRRQRARLNGIVAEAEWLADLIRQHLSAVRAASERADHADRVQVSNESAAAERLTCATQITVGWPGPSGQRAQSNEFVLAVPALPNLFFMTVPLLAGRMRRRRLPRLPGRLWPRPGTRATAAYDR